MQNFQVVLLADTNETTYYLIERLKKKLICALHASKMSQDVYNLQARNP
jgi:hypothetical protein